MNILLKELSYGNPTVKEKSLLDKKCLVDDLFNKFKSMPFPENDSESTKQEINDVVSFLSDIQQSDNSKFLNRYKFYDRNLFQAISNSFQSKEFDVSELCLDIKNDIENLIIRLKYNYNRPRPFQLAKHYKVSLFPFETKTGNNPSYPSKSLIYAYVILNVIANKDTEFSERAKSMIDDVSYSRLYLGLNFETDNDFSYLIAQEILKHPNFTKKHNI